MNNEYAAGWYNEGMVGNEGLPEIPGHRIFLFKGKSGQGGDMTTHEEISQWITTMLPPPAEAAKIKKVVYEEYVADCAGTGNEAMQEAMKREVEMMKAALHDSAKLENVMNGLLDSIKAD